MTFASEESYSLFIFCDFYRLQVPKDHTDPKRYHLSLKYLTLPGFDGFWSSVHRVDEASRKNFAILMCIGFMNTVLFWSYPSIMNDHEAMYSYPESELTRLTQDLYASSNNCINFSKISTTFIFPLQKDNYIPITITMYWKKRNEE